MTGHEMKKNWRAQSSLFTEPLPDLGKALSLLPEALERVWPLKEAHRKSLPQDIAELSQILTCQRGRLERPYWSKPAFVSAYLYYFLPWNILRLGRLLANLPLFLPGADKAPLLVDAGSGPLTLPIALWLVKKEWRSKPLHVLAVDVNRQPLQLGQKLFRVLGEILKNPIWPVYAHAASLSALAKEAIRLCAQKSLIPWTISAVNTLNEIKFRSHHTQMGENTISANLDSLLDGWSSLFSFASYPVNLLFVEPGTRLGGKLCMLAREAALELGLKALSPCPHQEKCVLMDEDGRASSWCHFTFSAQGAPKWLLDLSRQAGLLKKSLSLSFVLLSDAAEGPRAKGLPARVISQAFDVPDYGACRYGCCQCGLILLPDSRLLPGGCLTRVKLSGATDRRSGAKVAEPE